MATTFLNLEKILTAMYCYREYLSIATPTLTPTNFKNRLYERWYLGNQRNIKARELTDFHSLAVYASQIFYAPTPLFES